MLQERSVAIYYIACVLRGVLRKFTLFTYYTYWILYRLFEAPKLMRVIAMWRLRLLP